jgi:hypothetical protein
VFYDTLPGGGGRISNQSDLYSVGINASSLSGRVWFDSNNDGIYDGTASGISGVSMQLVGTDHLGNNVNLNTTTAPDGLYTFSNLRPGTYSIYETQPGAYFDGKDKLGSLGGILGSGSVNGTLGNDQVTSITIGLDSQATGTKYDFGELVPASLAGMVFDDRDNNGLVGGSEAGIASVTVTLTGTDDLGNAVSKSTTTNSGGAYSFANLRPSNGTGYTITETQPAAYFDGKDVIGTPGGTSGNDVFSNIVLNSGVNGINNNFGELVPASLSGMVFDDRNNNGLVDSEVGIGSVTVTLTGTDDLGNTVNKLTTTNAGGSYSFTNLRPSNGAGYSIAETQPSGYLDGKDVIGTPGGTTANDLYSAIVLNSGVNGLNNNFGELAPASLAGYVYHDLNDDGAYDGAASGLAGVTVTLTGKDDLGATVNINSTTVANGSYAFNNLRPSNAAGYTITETQPSGYLDGKDTLGTPGGVTSNDTFSSVVLNAGVNGTNNNFGELLSASIAGRVFRDVNNDETFNPATESGIGSVTVTLTGTNDFGNSVNISLVTQPDGTYSFVGSCLFSLKLVFLIFRYWNRFRGWTPKMT